MNATSNTKLTKEQKTLLALTKRDFPEVTLASNGETTVAFREMGNTVEFALAVASPNEKKFRRKVGEFHALNRFVDMQTVKMLRDDFLAWFDAMYFIAR